MKQITGKAESSTSEIRVEFKKFKNILDLVLRAVDSSVKKCHLTKQVNVDEKMIGFAIQNFFSLCKTADNKNFVSMLIK